MPTVRLRTLLRRPEVLVVTLAGLLLRVWVLLTPSGIMNADESVTGLSALDVAQGHFGILIPANNYTALVESYLFAPVVKVFGTHIVLLKLMPVVLWFVASVLAGLIAGRLAGARSAVTAFSLMWLIPGALLVISTRAYLGYAGGLCVVMAALLTLVVAIQDGLTSRRAVIAGALIGVAFIMHPIYLAGLGVAALVVTWTHRRDIRGWYLPVAAGFFAGISPWLLWNVRNDFASFSEKDVGVPSTFTERVRGNFSGLLPRDLGLRELGSPDQPVSGSIGRWVLAKPIGVVLVLVFLAGLVWALLRLWKQGGAARIVAVPAATSWILLAGFAHTNFVVDGRYGILPFPLGLVALGTALGSLGGTRRARFTPLAVLVAWVLLLVLPFQWRVVGREFGDPNAVPTQIVAALDQRGVNHVVGDYFDVLQLSYLTEGRIASKVFFPLPVRYPRLERRVEQASPDRVAFLFHSGGLRESELKLPLAAYERVDVPGYELYVPYEGSS